MLIRRGDIYYADLSPVVGSEQGGIRPVLIIQNDIGNRFSPTVIAAAITSRESKANLPTHIRLYADNSGLTRDSVPSVQTICIRWMRRWPSASGWVMKRSESRLHNHPALGM